MGSAAPSPAPPPRGDALPAAVPARAQEAVERAAAAPAGAAVAHDDRAVAAAGRSAEELTNAAVMASRTPFTISDARAPDRPLVWVNPAFERFTGYGIDDAVGRNCRFLQGPATDPATVARIRGALDAGEGVDATLLNYRADGTAFWNALSISPVRDGADRVTHFAAVQSDVTVAVTAQHELSEALALADAARADAEAARHEAESARERAEDESHRAVAARERLALLAAVSGVLSATLDVETAGGRLCSLLVPRLADWAVLTLLDDDGRPTTRALHREGLEEEVGRWLALRGAEVGSGTPLGALLDDRRPRLVSAEELGTARAASPAPQRAEMDEVITALGMRTAMVVPLVARRRVLGSLSLVSGRSGRAYGEDDLSVAVDLARRASLALDNVRLYSAEHATAVMLQRSLLPPVPEVAGLDAAAAYLPGNDRAEVGGDWYDVLDLPDGSTGLAVGDVMGHDIAAAASMGQLRSVLRSYAWEGGDPASVVDRLDDLVQGLGMADLATCVYARLDPAAPGDGAAADGDSATGDGAATDGSGADAGVVGADAAGRAGAGVDGACVGAEGSRRLVWANAGHHAPLLRHPDGSVEALEEGSSVLVGVDVPVDGGRAQAERVLARGSVLLLFTDGLVEARGDGVEPGLARVAALLAAHDPATGCAALTRALARDLLAHGQDDDVCLLAVRLL